jgi:hypothetical protein
MVASNREPYECTPYKVPETIELLQRRRHCRIYNTWPLQRSRLCRRRRNLYVQSGKLADVIDPDVGLIAFYEFADCLN